MLKTGLPISRLIHLLQKFQKHEELIPTKSKKQ